MTGSLAGHPDRRQLEATETVFDTILVGKLIFVFLDLFRKPTKTYVGYAFGLVLGPCPGYPWALWTTKTVGGFAPEPLGPYFEGFTQNSTSDGGFASGPPSPRCSEKTL